LRKSPERTGPLPSEHACRENTKTTRKDQKHHLEYVSQRDVRQTREAKIAHRTKGPPETLRGRGWEGRFQTAPRKGRRRGGKGRTLESRRPCMQRRGETYFGREIKCSGWGKTTKRLRRQRGRCKKKKVRRTPAGER